MTGAPTNQSNSAARPHQPETTMNQESTESTAGVPAQLHPLQAARADAASRFAAASAQFTAATADVVESLTAMLAAGLEADHLARRLGIDGAPEMRTADHLVGELRICPDVNDARVVGAVDAVLEPARATARNKLAALRAAGVLE